jgi:hypothetical protein
MVEAKLQGACNRRLAASCIRYLNLPRAFSELVYTGTMLLVVFSLRKSHIPALLKSLRVFQKYSNYIFYTIPSICELQLNFELSINPSEQVFWISIPNTRQIRATPAGLS